MGVIAEIHKISENSNRVLWALIRRNILKLIPGGQGQSFDAYILKIGCKEAELITLDRALRAKYYCGRKPPVVISKNRFIFGKNV